MARAIFSHELGDQDFQWLLSTFMEQHLCTVMVDAPCLPVILVVLTPEEKAAVSTVPSMPVIQPASPSNAGGIEEPPSE
jgi:hypothetical protein